MATNQARQSLEDQLRPIFPIFHWQYSGVAIPFFWGTGLAMIGLGLALDEPELIHDCFMLAYICLVVGFVFSVGYWLTSDFMQTLRTKAKRTRRPNKRRETRIKYYSWQYGVVAGVCLVFVLFMYFGLRIETTRRLSTFSGKLVPANDPFVPACGGASGDEAILLFGSAAAKFGHWPTTILKVNGRKRIVMDKDSAGTISLTAEVFSSDGKILTDVLKNAFNVNKNNIFKMERPDDSTLSIVDQNNETALYVRYKNNKEIQFDAKLYYSDSGDVAIMQQFRDPCLNMSDAGPEQSLFSVNGKQFELLPKN